MSLFPRASWSVFLSVLCLVTESGPTLCNPTDYSPPGSSVLGDSLGKNTGVGCHAVLQGHQKQEERGRGGVGRFTLKIQQQGEDEKKHKT